VGPVSAIPPGTVRIVYPEQERAGIGVFNVEGEFYALRNQCPHMGAPLCKGRIVGTSQAIVNDTGTPDLEWVRDGEIIACPWHHWEFDIKTGRTIFASRSRARRYAVKVESPEIAARLREGVSTFPVVVEDATVIIELGS
jgi:nitrite reductase/ring-hydroxylating ferredoxin subunit